MTNSPDKQESYHVVATLVVRCEIRAMSRFDACEQLEGMLASTMSWQAWGEGEVGEGLLWLDDGFPIITCVQ